jgi:hypothetical protein
MPALLPLTTVHGAFSAHVLAARLQSEGIDVELRGAIGAPYGITVGDMARVDLYVPEDQLDDARLVMLATEVDDAMDPPDERAPRAGRARHWLVVVAALLMVIAAAAPLIRWLVD